MSTSRNKQNNNCDSREYGATAEAAVALLIFAKDMKRVCAPLQEFSRWGIPHKESSCSNCGQEL